MRPINPRARRRQCDDDDARRRAQTADVTRVQSVAIVMYVRIIIMYAYCIGIL